MAKKLFISHPMRGKTKEEILVAREKAIASAYRHFGEGEKPLVIDSYFEDAPVDAKPLWYLAKSLELLSTADVAYFAKGWEEARGCRIENTCAIEYGIDVIQDNTDADEDKRGKKCEHTAAPDWEAMFRMAQEELGLQRKETDSLRRICERLGSEVNKLRGYKDAVERIFAAPK